MVFGGKINGDVDNRRQPIDRVNVGQSTPRRWNGRILQFVILQIVYADDDREEGEVEAFARGSVNSFWKGLRGTKHLDSLRLPRRQTVRVNLCEPRPSKLVPRIKEKIFRRCSSRDSQCLLWGKVLEVPTDQTGSPDPAKPHVEEILHY